MYELYHGRAKQHWYKTKSRKSRNDIFHNFFYNAAMDYRAEAGAGLEDGILTTHGARAGSKKEH